ncbi:MAG: hypothetical protein JF595_16180, partial [Sphingomonadales bacterium]|nr:hypothetical protein [Sphingomonadales bacterium]
DDMFAAQTAIEPGERSAREITEGEAAARQILLSELKGKVNGLDWKDLWPDVLDACVITHASLGKIAHDLWLGGQIVVPDWQGKAQKRPRDDFRLFSA